MPAISNLRQMSSAFRNARKTKGQIMAAFKRIPLGNYYRWELDWLYGIALTLAIFKDLLDAVSLGILGLITTFFISFIIWMIMFLTGSGLKRKVAKYVIRRYGALIIASLFEMLLGVNILPGTTLMVVIVFYLTLQERRAAAMEEKIAANEKGYPTGAEPAYN
jgi:hypothetical protein